MRTIFRLAILLVAIVFVSDTLRADPLLTSWYTTHSSRYARLYQSDAALTSGSSSTTWSRGSGTQTLPTYCGVSEVQYSSNWAYIRTTGLGSHVMGPWYLDSAHAQNFPNFPSNTASLYRFPRTPVTSGTTKTLTGGGTIGYFVDGVSMFDNRDTYSYSYSNSTDASPVGNIGLGDGIWNREAYVNEGMTFDPAYAHQAGNNYHYHANCIALRYELGDHVDYLASSGSYKEQTATPTKHSPVLGFAADGLPVYGPYGYASPLDANSGVRRMISGYIKRDGSYGSTNLNTYGRHELPEWARVAQGRSSTLLSGSQSGPDVSATYTLGHYLEDYDYLGDRGQTQGGGVFDLDKYNCRYCVTPEYPGGTYAYFITIESDGTPKFPHILGRWFYGTPTGGSVSSISETVTTQFHGGPDKTETIGSLAVSASNGDVTLVWSAIEGGVYTVQASNDLSSWSSLTPTVTAPSDTATAMESNAASGTPRRFYRLSRTSLSSYDSSGFDTTNTGSGGGGTTSVVPGGSGTRGTSVTVTITLPTNPPRPPDANVPTSVTLAGTISATAITRPTAGTVQCTFAIPSNAATGAKNVVVTFSPAPTYTLTGGFTIN